MEQIIQRLKGEKDYLETEYLHYGYREGDEWVQNASYSRIQCMLNWNGECWPEDKGIMKFVYEIIECDDLMDYNDTNFQLHPFNDFAKRFFLGFLLAVKDFWNRVEPELRESR